ncbi:MAG: ribosome maturation factor RimM [Halanaerobiales bacterium]
MDNTKMITIGTITKHQGNKGEVRILPLTDIPERFEMLESVYLSRDDQSKDDQILKKEIESIRFHKKFVILKFKGIDNISNALELKDYQVKITEDMILPLEDNQYYIDELIGYEVLTNDGQAIGNIADVISTGGTDVFVVKGKDREYMIPAAHEIITEVDEEEKRMVFDPIPGLLEL